MGSASSPVGSLSTPVHSSAVTRQPIGEKGVEDAPGISPFTFEEFGPVAGKAVVPMWRPSAVEKPCCIMTYPQEAR
jgi:hypothetical protein